MWWVKSPLRSKNPNHKAFSPKSMMFLLQVAQTQLDRELRQVGDGFIRICEKLLTLSTYFLHPLKCNHSNPQWVLSSFKTI